MQSARQSLVGSVMIDTKCPVCGFDLGFPPWNDGSASDEICPSCFIQFGYDDFADGDPVARKKIYLGWRKKWIDTGMPWSSRRTPPAGWNPEQRMRDAQLSG